MKVYKIVILVLAFFISATVGVLLFSSPVCIAAFSGYSPTSEEYQTLKDYAFEIASNSDTQLDEHMDVTKSFNERALTIHVKTDSYGVKATFPISNWNEKIENGIISDSGTIIYDGVTYSEENYVKNPLVYLWACFTAAVAVMGLIYLVFAAIPTLLIELIMELLPKKNPTEEDKTEKES